MGVKVPGNIVEGRGTPFPMGSFVGVLDKVEKVWTASDSDNAPDTKDQLDFALTFAENTPADSDSPVVGKRPFTTRLAIIRKNQSIVDIREFNDDTPYALQLTAGAAAQLAVALDFPCTVALDKSVDFDLPGFIENLDAGLFKGKRVGFTVVHRAWKSKKTSRSGTSADVARFFAAEEGTNVQIETEAGAATPAALSAVRGR